MWAYLLQCNFKSLIIILSLLSLIFLSRKSFQDIYYPNKKRNNPLTIYALFSILFSVFVFLAPVINGSYTGWDTLRYNIGFFYISILNLGVIIYLCLKKQRFQFITSKWLVKISIALIVIALSAGVARYSQDGIKKYFDYYPADVEKIDNVADKYGLKSGVGHYWIAKYTTMFSRKDVVIHPVFDHIEPFYHVVNENIFYADSAVYNFIVLNRFVDTTAYKSIFGEGTLLTKGDNPVIVQVGQFRFNRKTHRPYLINSPNK
jgi:hypothetical protein